MNFFKNLFKANKKTNIEENKPFSADISVNATEISLPNVNFEPLHREGNSYITTRKVAFKKVRDLKAETIDKVFDFAYTMAFDEKHRKTRSGGRTQRKNGRLRRRRRR